MIIIDYSQISIASFYAQPNAELSEDFLRHMILNTIRMYSHKFKGEYGDIVIACDGGKSWRKGYFPQYKAHRKKAREDSGMDWNLFFQYLNQIREEIKENFPYKVIHLEHVEADDVIAVLVKETQEFGKNEPVMIISSDKDFIQLHKYKNVKQFSPIQKKMVSDPNPPTYIYLSMFFVVIAAMVSLMFCLLIIPLSMVYVKLQSLRKRLMHGLKKLKI